MSVCHIIAFKNSILFVNCIVNWKLKSKWVPPQRTQTPTCGQTWSTWSVISSSSSLSVQGSSEARQTRLHQMRRVLHGQIQGLFLERKKNKNSNKFHKFPINFISIPNFQAKVFTNVWLIGQLLSVHSVHSVDSPPRLDFGCISSTRHAVPGPWSQWDICEHWENATKRLEKCVKTCDVSKDGNPMESLHPYFNPRHMNLLKAMKSFHQAAAIRFIQKERTLQGRCAHHLQIQKDCWMDCGWLCLFHSDCSDDVSTKS